MNHREDYAKEAMHDGRHAARSGDGKNPHTPGSLEYAAWEQGWEGVEEQEDGIDKLIAELESATKGSRKLDDAISTIIGRPPPQTGGYYGWEDGPGYYSRPKDSEGITREIWESRHFTTSLDAALTLVPEGTDIDLYVAGHNSSSNACAVDILHPETEEKFGTGNNRSTALALCIAALKARQAMEAH